MEFLVLLGVLGFPTYAINIPDFVTLALVGVVLGAVKTRNHSEVHKMHYIKRTWHPIG